MPSTNNKNKPNATHKSTQTSPNTTRTSISKPNHKQTNQKRNDSSSNFPRQNRKKTHFFPTNRFDALKIDDYFDTENTQTSIKLEKRGPLPPPYNRQITITCIAYISGLQYWFLNLSTVSILIF